MLLQKLTCFCRQLDKHLQNVSQNYERVLRNSINNTYNEGEDGVKHIIDKETKKIIESFNFIKYITLQIYCL